MKPILDSLGRPLRDLRISVTDRCNFRCRYCMPEELFGPYHAFLPASQLLRYEEIERLVRIFARLGVNKVRITGGEPLLRRELSKLIRMISSIDAIEDIALTTNGIYLKRYAYDLKQAGLKRVNVSLDTLDDRTFSLLNSRKYKVSQVLEGIEAAAKAGLQVKINMVVIKGINDHEIVKVARHFREQGHIVRFIEYMDVGNSNDWDPKQVVSKQEILNRIQAEMPVAEEKLHTLGEVATRFHYQGSQAEFGIIPSITEPFCSTCTRLRLSSDGFLYTCLFATAGHNLRDYLRSAASDEKIEAFIRKIWQERQDRYSEKRSHQPTDKRAKKIEMSYIGG
ncbi:GTP 3',8-cyclase MoaA [Thermoactinomyces sp. CICC 10522]|uniref:GTP 3',8-cyclase MoaA n=1 Tax=Thermoactinomyces sp. CICC 10522 TaxID=2767427 RepID=UPI0018DD01FD|nr:GTP 3',8-cyclase MoaA [Thermoactinomyces sp. CICC 10522]MBH8605728.1 GTP 3',8-cyclase MoaA [Thermoactinomyces sp. CICC 10522]